MALNLRRPLMAIAITLLVAPVWLAGVSSPAAGRVGDPPTASSARSLEAAHGRWPLRPEPAVVRRFDPPSSPWGAGHRGVDLAGSAGQAVHASLPGRVTYAGPLAGRGVVVVDHGETRTTYEPVVAQVRPGQVVTAGGRLGVLESAGSHCAPATCLHWGWIRGDVYLDPLLLVGAGPVRLLPLSGLGSPERIPGARWAAPLPRPGVPQPSWTRLRSIQGSSSP